MKSPVSRYILRSVRGERRYTHFGFHDLIAAQAVDMMMPDIVRYGRTLETKKNAAMAESYYMQVSPHNPNSAVATIVSLQLMTNIPKSLLLAIDDDYLKWPTKPGLGTELVMRRVENDRVDG